MHLLLMALFAAAQNAFPEKCTISGTVIHALTGEPLHRVQILAEGGSSTTPFTTTDAKGNFTLVDLNPGQYRLKGQRNGYLDTYYGSRRAEGKGVPISVEAGQEVKGLQFKLLPFGVIAGTIREADGEPLERALSPSTVCSFKVDAAARASWKAWMRHTLTTLASTGLLVFRPAGTMSAPSRGVPAGTISTITLRKPPGRRKSSFRAYIPESRIRRPRSSSTLRSGPKSPEWM